MPNPARQKTNEFEGQNYQKSSTGPLIISDSAIEILDSNPIVENVTLTGG